MGQRSPGDMTAPSRGGGLLPGHHAQPPPGSPRCLAHGRPWTRRCAKESPVAWTALLSNSEPVLFPAGHGSWSFIQMAAWHPQRGSATLQSTGSRRARPGRPLRLGDPGIRPALIGPAGSWARPPAGRVDAESPGWRRPIQCLMHKGTAGRGAICEQSWQEPWRGRHVCSKE